MKRLALALAALLFAIPVSYATLQHYQPGKRLIDGSQLNLMVDQVNGIANAVNGVASDYKLARGETALDGANPTPVTTGLTTIVACTATIKTSSAPGVSTSVITYDTSSGTLNLYGWKVTSSADTTLIASTGTDTVGWSCVGT